MAPRAALALLLALPALAGCLGEGTAPGSLAATVRFTEGGVPHIVAQDWGGLGLGFGWASGRDHLCVLAEEWATLRGERSLHWGPDGGYRIQANGAELTNLQSDTFWAFVGASPDLYRSSALAARPEMRAALEGFVEGWNRYLREVPPGAHAACRGAPWVGPIEAADLERRVLKVQLLASSLAFAPGIADAAPPGEPRPAPRGALPLPGATGIGSNAYALGRDATAGGRGALLGNPHFPWQGPERFHMLHLTIPGQVDVMGATLLGLPVVAIGFTEAVAWSHTVSTAWRFTLHELKLAPGDPTAYVVDGGVERMEPREVRVPLPGGGEEVRVVWLTRWGPVVEMGLLEVAGEDVGLGWSHATAYAVQDANARNERFVEQWFRFNTAPTFDAFAASLDEVMGSPFVNTIAASPDGRVLYADVGVVPHVTDARVEACNTALGAALLATARLPVLDGSRGACGWEQDASSPQPGAFPPSALPRLVRTDYVLNSNDSHWLANAREPLEGYPLIVGDERAPRSGRTRLGLQLLEGGEAQGWSAERLRDMLTGSPLYFADLVVPAVLRDVCALPLPLPGQDVGAACAALQGWDRTARTDSRGLALFERFWLLAPRVWAEPFDAARPIDTPRGYLAADPRVRAALAQAAAELAGAGIALDAPASASRAVQRGAERIAVPGAHGNLGSINMMVFPFAPGEGFAEPIHGSSYVQAVGWDARGVRADAMLTYSQSTDPGSAHAADLTPRFERGPWLTLPFRDADVRAATLQTVQVR